MSKDDQTLILKTFDEAVYLDSLETIAFYLAQFQNPEDMADAALMGQVLGNVARALENLTTLKVLTAEVFKDHWEPIGPGQWRGTKTG